jgi:hypothetical protein
MADAFEFQITNDSVRNQTTLPAKRGKLKLGLPRLPAAGSQ